ncbi:hypothetical protein F2P56_015123, partial [Juglans regia]
GSAGEDKEDDIAIAFLFSITFSNPIARESGPTMGVLPSFEYTLNQAEVPQRELPDGGPSPFEERLAEVEVSFGECLMTPPISPPNGLRTDPSGCPGCGPSSFDLSGIRYSSSRGTFSKQDRCYLSEG